MDTQRGTLVGIFLLSFATLLLELALTRVLSVALWYHFGFLVISTALLGFGAAGVTLATWTRLRERIPLGRALAVLSLAFGVVTLASFWLMQRIPFDPFALFSDRRQFLYMPIYYLTLAAPFVCSGLAIALLLTRRTHDVNRLYAYDLLGAGLGCAAIVLVMPRVGGSGSVVAAASCGFLAAAAFGLDAARSLSVIALAGAVASAVLAPAAERVLPITLSASKGSSKRAPLYTAWNTFSRIDVYEYPNDPPARAPSERVIVFDQGTAGTSIDDLRPNIRHYLEQPPDSTDFDSWFAYAGRPHPRVLIIGSGAGQEVLEGLEYGASSITAVEINPIIVDVVTHRMRDYWGDLFAQPGVHLVNSEGRSFVRRSHDSYDLLISEHTISNAAVASGALGLTENYVLTLEAFEDYFDHLTPDGLIFFTRPEAQIPRLFATARELFAQRGLDHVADHVLAFRQANQPQLIKVGRKAFVAGFLLKKSPFTSAEVDEIAHRLRATPGGTGPNGVELLYTPFGNGRNTIYDSLLTAPDVRSVYRATPVELEPATDDRPFFNQHARWSSIGASTIRDVFTQKKMGRMALEDRPVAEVTLLVLLAQSVLVAAVLILLPLAGFARRGLQVADRWRYLAYFGALGIGFIFVEIALLQRFTLFLGQPVYTLAVVLAGLLMFAGVGAALAGRARTSPQRALGPILLGVIVILMATALLTPAIFAAALGLPLPVRALIAFLLIAPVGIALGMPFPTGLRIVSLDAAPIVPWAWGVNGFFTVIGSVAAMILGMAFGFTAVLEVAGLCYLVALMALAGRGNERTTLDVGR
jgi:hypothetical protein